MLQLAYMLSVIALAALGGWWLGQLLALPIAWLLAGVVGWVAGSVGLRLWHWSQR